MFARVSEIDYVQAAVDSFISAVSSAFGRQVGTSSIRWGTRTYPLLDFDPESIGKN